MAVQLIDPSKTQRLERILIYGDPKTGKTRLATSLPDSWGRVLYVGADAGAESLAPVLATYRNRLVVLKPSGGTDPKSNPHYDAFDIATRDWTKEVGRIGEGVKTLVWDTMTSTALDILSYVATSGQFSAGAHISLGTPGSAEHQKLPMQGDYMATHNIISRLVDFLFKQPLHLIVICHATFDEPRDGGGAEGGPATAGKATVRSFPGRFDAVIHLQRRSSGAGGVGMGGAAASSVVTAFTERHGIWSAGVRSGHASNPMPRVDLASDPRHFWESWAEHYGQKPVAAVAA